MPRPSDLADFVDHLQSRGRRTFTRAEAARAAPNTSPSGIAQALRRLAGRGRIVHLRAGFYVIVPLEYKATGIIPPTWFVDDLMRFIGQPYYVGLLSAAALQGAAHQQPQELQVVTTKPVRVIQLRRARIVFVTNSRAAETPAVQRKVDSGYFRVSTPAATALDLVRYVSHAGGLSNVANVLSELTETLSPEELASYARTQIPRERPALQRLGYLLGCVGAKRWESVLHPAVFPARATQHSSRRRDTLPALLAEVPSKTFWKSNPKTGRVPNFNRIFGWYVRCKYKGRLPKGDRIVSDLEAGKVVNLSTFQRVVAAEARRRVPMILLRPCGPVGHGSIDRRWSLVVNEAVEPD